MIELRVKRLDSDVTLPARQTQGSSGYDVYAYLPENVLVIEPGAVEAVPTGISMEIPLGYECQVRPRSGLAARNAVTVVNAPGTIDSDYRGELKVLLINLGDSPFTIENGMRVAQLVFAAVESISWLPVDGLASSARGSGGFGHTGLSG